MQNITNTEIPQNHVVKQPSLDKVIEGPSYKKQSFVAAVSARGTDPTSRPTFQHCQGAAHTVDDASPASPNIDYTLWLLA